MTEQIKTIGDLEKAIEDTIKDVEDCASISCENCGFKKIECTDPNAVLHWVLEKIGEVRTYIEQKIEDGKCVSCASYRCDYKLCLTCPIKADGLQEILNGKFREPFVSEDASKAKKALGDDESG